MSNLVRIQRPLSCQLAVMAGVLLLVLAVPYAVSSALLLDERKSLDAAIGQHELAYAVFPHSETARGLATLRVAAVRNNEASWQVAQQALEASLQQRPQDPHGWAQLAYVYGEQKNHALLGPALARSIETGAYMPGFMQWRFLLALAHWPELTAYQQQLVANQALLLWKTKPNDFIRLARMPALAPQIESLMREYYAEESPAFLQRRRALRHTQPIRNPN